MGLFDLFKKPKPKPQPEPEEQTLEELLADLRAKRMAECMPVIKRGAVADAPESFDHFNLNDVLIGTVQGQFDRFLFAGDNMRVLHDDLNYLNDLAQKANALVSGIPFFAIDPFSVAFEPFPDIQRQRWLYSKIAIEEKTPTGKLKKYPVSALIETQTGEKQARLYYTIDGIIGKGGISVHVNPNTKEFVVYGFDFINGKVSHVWKSNENGKTVLYNKNEG